jgi:signal transduction histidine kinase
MAANTQNNAIDSIKRVLQTQKADTNKVHTLVLLSYLYAASHPDTGVIHSQQALDLAKRLDFEEGILEAEGSLSNMLLFTGNYPLALDHGFKAVSLAKRINRTALGYTYSLLSYSYYFLGDYNTCLQYTREAMKVAQPWETAFAWRDLSVVYHRLNFPDSALLYAQKAYEKLKGSEAVGNVSNVLGDAYAGKGQYDSALVYYQNGLAASMKNPAVTEQTDNYNGIAGVFKATGKLDSALWYSKKVLAAKLEKKYPIGLLKAANMLAGIYEAQNKPDSALKYLRIALAVKDSLFSREKTMAIQNLAFKEQEKQKEIHAAELNLQNRIRMYALLGGLIVVLAIAGLLYRSNWQKQKANTKLEKAYGELKTTQQQLIQSEKMASLGELTAGIAHEIQNPLNFVNNFAEINKELVADLMLEADRGNLKEVKAFATDIEENSQKISHHGQRADAIVKGMLQHARASSSEKQLTDINALTDEYLRLSYQAVRSKDKTFQAVLETHFDESLPKINVVPKDFSRVLLNLFNNAFYAVQEKKAKLNGTFESVVSVSTKKDEGNILITVKDNGPGMLEKVAQKVFQPFFTTKPTGEGTGLGLSLSYDIITKGHAGSLNVQSTEGEGSEFTITIPIT